MYGRFSEFPRHICGNFPRAKIDPQPQLNKPPILRDCLYTLFSTRSITCNTKSVSSMAIRARTECIVCKIRASAAVRKAVFYFAAVKSFSNPDNRLF